MSIPSTKASTANVDQGTDSISSARADIKQNIDNVNEIIDHLTAFGANKLVIPFGGYVVTNTFDNWAIDSAGEQTEKAKFFRMALLGGAYYLRNATLTSAPSLTSAETAYGSIEGASVSTATPTLVLPTGYSWTGTNVAGNITNGFISNTGTMDYDIVNADIDVLGGGGATRYIGYGLGYDSYVRLPAGTYMVNIQTNQTGITDTYTTETLLEDNTENMDKLWIYNKTDDSEITLSNYLPNDRNALETATDWSKDGAVVFTIAGTKDIQFFNSVNPASEKDELSFRLSQATVLTGDVTSADNRIYRLDPKLPAKLGWVTLVPNTYVVIQKL